MRRTDDRVRPAEIVLAALLFVGLLAASLGWI
ncbi:MAG: hypothetical protein JW394_0693 [Nitrospira sp.]|nr:hypothetical protein [Nitrospira sp.]